MCPVWAVCSIAGLCHEFGVFRKTGYRIFNRYKDSALEGLTDRSRRPYRQANQLPSQIEELIVKLKKYYPHWGAKDKGTAKKAVSGFPMSRHQHRACRSRSQRPAQAQEKTPLQGQGNRPFQVGATQRAVVCRFQGRVHAYRPALLLSLNHYRLCQPLLDRLRRTLNHQRVLCLHRF